MYHQIIPYPYLKWSCVWYYNSEAEFSNSTMDEEQKNNDNGIYPTTNVKDAAKPKQGWNIL